MHPAQRRHAPPRMRNPATSPAEGSGEPLGFPSGEREGRSPSDRRDSRCRGGVIRHDDVPTPAHGRPRGAAPTNRGRPYMITCSGGMHPNRMNCRPHHLRRGLGRRGDEATKRRVMSQTQASLAATRCQPSCFRLHRCTPRSGGIRPGACAIRPRHLQRGLGNRQGSPAGSLRGSAPQIGETPIIGEVSSYRMPAVISVADRGGRAVCGAARPKPAGGASPATPPGALHPRDPRMVSQYHFAQPAAHAVRRSAGAVTNGRPFG
jgi:hypothetical protein